MITMGKDFTRFFALPIRLFDGNQVTQAELQAGAAAGA